MKHYRNRNGGSCYINTSPTHHNNTNPIVKSFNKISTAKVDLKRQSPKLKNFSKQKSKIKYNNNTNSIKKVKAFTKGNAIKVMGIKRNTNVNLLSNTNTNTSHFNNIW